MKLYLIMRLLVLAGLLAVAWHELSFGVALLLSIIVVRQEAHAFILQGMIERTHNGEYP